jgi:hypothetical protein
MGARQIHRPRHRPQRPHGPARQQLPRPSYVRRPLRRRSRRTTQLRRFTFLEVDAAHDFYPDWDGAADTCIAILRTEAGRDPHDKDLHDLVGELSTRSDEFRRHWSAHNVRYHGAGTKHFHHHDVGDLQLAYESVDMISEPGLTLTLYAAEPGSPTEHALALLASWAATENLGAPERFGDRDRLLRPLIPGSLRETSPGRSTRSSSKPGAGHPFWDTANVYQAGSSEEFVGRMIKTYARREEIVVVTKVSPRS